MIGGIVALQGLVITHDAYAEKTIRVLVRERLARARLWLRVAVNRLLRRREHRSGTVSASLGLGGSLRARAVIGWGPLPGTTRAAIAELDRRVRDVHRRLDNLDNVVADSSDESRKALETLRAEITQQNQKAIQLVRHAAIEGLMREAVGLFLVIIGSALQGWGAVAGA